MKNDRRLTAVEYPVTILVNSRFVKIAWYTIDTRLRASSRHGGARVFFPIHSNHRGRAPPMAAAIIVPDGEKGDNFRHRNRIQLFSLLNQTNSTEFDAHPPQGLSESRRGNGFFYFFPFTEPSRGRPSGATAIIVPGGERGNKFLSHYGFLLYPASASYFLPNLQSRRATSPGFIAGDRSAKDTPSRDAP